MRNKPLPGMMKHSPLKHDKSAGGHSKTYGKHTNADHPRYWKGNKEGELINTPKGKKGPKLPRL